MFGVAAGAVAVLLASAAPDAGRASAASTEAGSSVQPAAMSFTSVDYPGATNTSVTGVNTGGEVVGYFTDDVGVHGFTQANGQFSLPIDMAGTDTRITSVNDAGTMTGTYMTDSGGVEHAFILTAAGTLTSLDDPAIATGGQWDRWGTVATAINSNGVVAGYYFSTDLDGFTYPDGSIGSNTINHGFVWKNGQFTTFDAPGVATPIIPYAGTFLNGINKAGVLVGSATYIESDTVFGEMGFVASGTSVTRFRDQSLPRPEGIEYDWCDYTRPYAINDLGTMVGVSGNGCADLHLAWLRIGSQFSYLNYPGATRTTPASINNDGVVGGTWNDGTADHGFVVTIGTATVSGYVTTTGTFYPGTRFGVRACPASGLPEPGCAGGAQILTDSAGRYTLTLTPGAWNVAAFAWQGGNPSQETATAQWNVTLDQGQTLKHDFQLMSQYGGISGTVRADWFVPAGTTFSAQACPGSPTSFSPTCAGGATASADGTGRYSLALPPGPWSVAGLAQPPDGDPLLGAVQQFTVTVSRSITANFSVTSPFGAVNGVVRTTGYIPTGTTYAALACQTTPVTVACGSVAQADGAGRYTLVLTPGTWYVAGAVFPPGGGGPSISTPTTVVVSPHVTSGIGPSVVSTPWGAVNVTVNTLGLFPAGTVLGAYACPPGPSCTAPASPTAAVDSRSNATLVLLPGSWNIWAGAWTPGRPPVTRPGSTVSVTLSSTPNVAVTIPSPYAGVTGSVSSTVRFPASTTYGAVACPSTETFSLTCPSAVSTTSDTRGNYTLVLPPGQWTIDGVAYVGTARTPVLAVPSPITAPAGTIATVNFSVRAPTFLQLSVSLNASRNTSVQVSATLADISGNRVANVPVAFTLGSGQCTAATNRNGQASCMLPTGSTPGSTFVWATFTGDYTYTGSTAAAPITIR